MNNEDKINHLKELIRTLEGIEDSTLESIILCRKLRTVKLKELEELENE